MPTLAEMFEKYDDEPTDFDLVENKTSNRRDLHAMLLLDEILPGNGEMIAAAEHDQIWFDVDTDELAQVITDEQVKELTACGVFCKDDEYLSMFV